MPPRRPKVAKPSIQAAIKSDALIKRLQIHAHTHPNKRNFKSQYMQPSQVQAAVALLKKTVPDLKVVEMDVSGDVSIEVLRVDKHKAAK